MTVDMMPIIGLILHFRTPEQTLVCLRSLMTEGIRRVVVVDNSEDGGRSLNVMKEGLAESARLGMEIGLVEPRVNLGFAAGVREGLSSIGYGAAGHVLLINSDAKLEAGSVQRMRQRLDEAGVVAPMAKEDDRAEPASPIVFYHRLAALYLRRPHRYAHAYPSGTCLLIRNDVLSPELFDRDFFFYGEDVELGYSLAQRRIRFTGCEEAFVIHAGSASAGNGSMFYEYHMNRAHWLLARKLARNPFEYAMFCFMRGITLPARALVRSIRLRSLIPWRGLMGAIQDVARGTCRTFTPAP